jgi:transposase InsO family protein
VIGEGATVTEVAAQFGVSRKTVHAWLRKYEAGGLEGLADGSHRPRSCPHQMPAEVEVALVQMRRAQPSWGPRRLVFELARAGVVPVPSESGVYRALARLGLIDPAARRPRDRRWRRWERGAPMELWQMDTVGGFVLADGRRAKALTGIDDHSRFCVSAFLMPRESSQRVCDGLALAMRRYGVPQQVLTDNGKVFTGRFNRPAVEVLFDRVCRENGVEHLLTQPRSPTTTGKVERFHRALRAEFGTDRVFASLQAAQTELDAWVEHYNHERPHQGLDMATPASRFLSRSVAVEPIRRLVADARPVVGRGDGDMGRPPRLTDRGGGCELAAGRVGPGRCRQGHRRMGDRPGAAVLGRRHPAADPGTHDIRADPQETCLDPRRTRETEDECYHSTGVDLSPINRRSAGPPFLTCGFACIVDINNASFGLDWERIGNEGVTASAVRDRGTRSATASAAAWATAGTTLVYVSAVMASELWPS